MACFLQLVYIVSVVRLTTSFASDLAFAKNTSYTPSVKSADRSHINEKEDIERTIQTGLPKRHVCLNYTMRPESVRKCPAVLQCLYGQCVATDDGQTKCICDEGAVGLSCRYKCCRECGRHGKCVIHNNGEEICSCHQGYEGDHCELLLGRKDLSGITKATKHLPQNTNSGTVVGDDITEKEDSFNACSDGYLMRPQSDRKCMFGMLCLLGYCHEGSCECDQGAVGFLCNTKCCKDCGEHGQCYKSSGTPSEICNCESEFTGVRCEKRKTLPSNNMEHSSDNMEHSSNSTEHSSANIKNSSNNTEHSSNKNSVHVCSDDYVMRPESERICFLGILCRYGLCEQGTDDSQVCRCDRGASGILCDRCCKDCGDFGLCYITDNGTQICNCWSNYTGLACDIFVGMEENLTSHNQANSQWYIWVVGTCSIVLVALIVVLVIIPYFMWKYRVILVMKVVHYFQGFEDDDEREWDAFISYKSSAADEQFVTQVLFPKLEDEFGFKLHVHYRDFIPGDTIANNIIRAVKGSRRSILIITPQYAEGEYTKLEYQVAQQQMLKHKHRIIPILLDDISECKETLDPNLKFILRSVTYLEWPHDNSERRLNRFWKRIQLSMPKKRNQNPRNMIRGRIQALENGAIKRNCRLPVQLEQNGVLNRNLHFENEHDHYDRIKDIERL